jgi:hypothetical protein
LAGARAVARLVSGRRTSIRIASVGSFQSPGD